MITFSSNTTAGLVLVLLACLGTVLATANNNGKDAKDASKSAAPTKPETVWNVKQLKTSLKREALPIPSAKLNSGKSSESLRTASQTLFGYNGMQGVNNAGGGGGQFGYNGFGNNQGFGGGQQFGFSPNYINGGAGGRGGANGYNQYAQLGNAYNVLDQNQGGFFGGQGQGQNPYFGNSYFGGQQGGFGGYNPYASTGGIGGAYPFGNQQGGGFGGFGGIGQQGFYPGAQYSQGQQVGSRNFGFINQGFGNPAFRNPQQGGISPSVPTSVQVGTGLEVGNRGFSGGAANTGGFPSASGQQYIVGNGIGQPAFIGGVGAPAPGNFGYRGPYGGMYSGGGGIPGGVYRQQSPNSGFGPYDYRRALSGTPPSSATSRPSSSATRLQTSGPNRFYQGAGPTGSYAPNSRERLYRFTTSNEN